MLQTSASKNLVFKQRKGALTITTELYQLLLQYVKRKTVKRLFKDSLRY